MRRSIIALLCIASTLACAQPAPAPSSLGSILDRLQTNVDAYRATIPSFFADEHVTSQMKRNYSPDSKTVTDSIFRLTRRDPPLADLRLNLEEAHELRAVNRVPVRRDSLILPGPVVVDGVFSNGVAIVSRELEHCFDYTLHPGLSYAGQPAVAVDFRFKAGSEKGISCSGLKRSSGTAIFDAAALHPLHVEMAVPDRQVTSAPEDLALWRWRIDYLPVTFDGRQYWLPSHIRSRIDANDETTTWYFEADYSNYHKLTVTSHILPAGSGDAP